MVSSQVRKNRHPGEVELADLLSGGLPKKDRERLEEHISSCDQCLDKVVASHEVVSALNRQKPPKRLKESIVKKLNICLLLAVISFSLSFMMPHFFIQLLVATLLLGIKWVVDSKSTKMLIMIHEAWKRDGGRGASDVIETLEAGRGGRFSDHEMKRPKSPDLGLHTGEDA